MVSCMSFITFSRIMGHLSRDVVYPKLLGSPVNEIATMSVMQGVIYQRQYPLPKTLSSLHSFAPLCPYSLKTSQVAHPIKKNLNTRISIW